MKAKKSLGQNFLVTQSVVDEIIKTANLNLKDIVLEVGPGKGILTQTLLGTLGAEGKVIAVEKDDNLIPFLQERFKKEIKSKKLTLIKGDILDFDFKNLWKRSFLEEECSKMKRRERRDPEERFSNFKIVANIPYYITGKFLQKTLSSDIKPSMMVLLLQKEVAQRIATSRKESILSISVKAYGEPKYIKTVKRGNFNPAPKVDSAILSINNISKSFFYNEDGPRYSEKRFFEVVKMGFAHKRKLLMSNLRDFGDKEKLEKIFEKIKINKKARAENLSIEEWGGIVKELNLCRPF